MVKEKYFVNLQSKQISQNPHEDNHAITIYATQSEVMSLRKMFNEQQSADFMTFFRSNVPIMPYHNSKSNDRYDKSFTEAIQLMYDLGDEEARKFIEETGILGDKPIDTNHS
jgi:hypothetical protein